LHDPFSSLGDSSFEHDENGVPYWVIQTLKYKWVNVMPSVSGVIICNALTGETQHYNVDQVPKWIDNVYDANLVIDEINSWGMYQGGFANSQFTQKGVVQTTDGYTYIIKDDDVFMYTGITSIASDESNIGFVMVNLRTHEARYYGVPGAEEYGAMESAKGVVQEKNYTSTFPLLINLNGRPTYLLSLKDSGGLVKMYAFVDVENYQKVSVTDSSYGIKYAADEYLKMLNGNVPDKPDDQPKEMHTSTITIATINNILVDGNTIYYVLSADNEKYEIPATVDLSIVPFMKEGDVISVTYYTAENGLNIVTKVQNNTGEQGE
ncbi:MAG: CvpA family protein, partial [Erysipelotrichaceae bacterium]|nr:CvpA family protein [Erysipelotrichaceae bacterium]